MWYDTGAEIAKDFRGDVEERVQDGKVTAVEILRGSESSACPGSMTK